MIQQYGDDPNRFLICGTNAFKPMCREYVDERGRFVWQAYILEALCTAFQKFSLLVKMLK